MAKFATKLDVVFGLAFDVEKDSTRPSGFKPAQFDQGAGRELFANIRLSGFAELCVADFTRRIVIAGGDEQRYKNEIPRINRAEVICKMLVEDCGINADFVEAIPSNSNTGGNLRAIQGWRETHPGYANAAIVSNLYHLPRVVVDLIEADMILPLYPAESFLLLDDTEIQREHLLERFGGSRLAERIVQEAQGIADKLLGRYKPRVDVAPVDLSNIVRQKA